MGLQLVELLNADAHLVDDCAEGAFGHIARVTGNWNSQIPRGQEVDRIVGAVPKAMITKKLDAALAK